MKLNKKGYLIVEIIVASVIALTIAFLLLELTLNLKDKNEDFLVETQLETDKALITKEVMNDISAYKLIRVSTNNSTYVDLTFDNDITKRISIEPDTRKFMYGNYDGSKYIDDEYYFEKVFSNKVTLGNINIENLCHYEDGYSECEEDLTDSDMLDVENGLLRINIDAKTIYSDYNYGLELNINYKVREMQVLLRGACFTEQEIKEGTKFTKGQYVYSYVGNHWTATDKGSVPVNGWSVKLANPDSTDPVTTELCTSINSKPIVVMTGMFENSKATSIDLSSFDTSNVIDMSSMFKSSSVTSLDLSNFDTSNVINMSSMFYNSSATNLDLSSFDTSNVLRMYLMFYGSKATSVDLSNFDTSSVTDMLKMFYESSATSLDLSSFDTSNIKDMSYMFYRSAAKTITFGENFDTSNVTNMSSMFNGSFATSLDLSVFNTKSVTNMSDMFSGSVAKTITFGENFKAQETTNMNGMFRWIGLENLNLSTFQTKNVNNMSNMFSGSSIKSITFGENFDTSNVTSMYWMFRGCFIDNLDLSKFDTKNVKNIEAMFAYSSIKTITFGENFTAGSATSMKDMFRENNTESLDLSNFNPKNVTNMSYMFYRSATKNIIFGDHFDVQSVTDMSYMFYESQAENLDFTGFNPTNVEELSVTTMYNMFNGCDAKTITFGDNFNSTKLTNMNNMFNTTHLTNIDFGGFDTSSVTNMGGLFQYSNGTATIDLSGFDTSKVEFMGDMFNWCGYPVVDLSSFDISSVTNGNSMFDGSFNQKMTVYYGSEESYNFFINTTEKRRNLEFVKKT